MSPYRILRPHESREVVCADPGERSPGQGRGCLSVSLGQPNNTEEPDRPSVPRTPKYVVSMQNFGGDEQLVARRSVATVEETHETEKKRYRILTTEERQLVAATPRSASASRYLGTPSRIEGAKAVSQYGTGYVIAGNYPDLQSRMKASELSGYSTGPVRLSTGGTQHSIRPGFTHEEHISELPLNYQEREFPTRPQHFRGLSIEYGEAEKKNQKAQEVPTNDMYAAPSKSKALRASAHIYYQTSSDKALGEPAHYVQTPTEPVERTPSDYALKFTGGHVVSVQRSTSTKRQPSDPGVGRKSSSPPPRPSSARSTIGGTQRRPSGIEFSKMAIISRAGVLEQEGEGASDGPLASSNLTLTRTDADNGDLDDTPVTTVSYQSKLVNPYTHQQANMTGTKPRCLPTTDYIDLLKSQRTLEYVPSPPYSPKPGEANPRSITDIVHTGPSLYSQYITAQMGAGSVRAGTKQKALLEAIKVQTKVLMALKQRGAQARTRGYLADDLRLYDGAEEC